jgi:hypothetical protein
VVRAIARSLSARVGVQVDLRGVDALVSEPERNDDGVDVGLQ